MEYLAIIGIFVGCLVLVTLSQTGIAILFGENPKDALKENTEFTIRNGTLGIGAHILDKKIEKALSTDAKPKYTDEEVRRILGK